MYLLECKCGFIGFWRWDMNDNVRYIPLKERTMIQKVGRFQMYLFV